MFFTPENFIESRLEEFNLPMQFLIISYNSIFGYADGVTEKEVNGVKVIVQSGYILSKSLLERGYKKDVNMYLDVHEKLSKEVSKICRAEETQLIVMVYAGVNFFEHALECAAGIKSTHLNSKVYVLTCDCDFENKVPRMDVYFSKNAVDGFLVSKQCGGGLDLMNILFAIFEKCKA